MKSGRDDLSTKDLEHLARLSHLKLTSEELTKIGSQLNETLHYVENLSEFDTTNISPQKNAFHSNAWREDVVDKSRILSQTDALVNAKNKKSGYFVVKRMI